VRLVLEVVMQNDRDFMDVNLLNVRICCTCVEHGCPTCRLYGEGHTCYCGLVRGPHVEK
jgi:hypothetical protein